VRAMEARVIGDGAVVSGEAVSHAKSKIRLNRRVTLAVGHLVEAAAKQLQEGTSEGPAVLTAERRTKAAQALAKHVVVLKEQLDSLHVTTEAQRLPAARTVTAAARTLYQELAAIQRSPSASSPEAEEDTAGLPLGHHLFHPHDQGHRIHDANKALRAQILMLSNMVVAAAPEALGALREAAGIDTAAQEQHLSEQEQEHLSTFAQALRFDLNAALTTAITLGEAQAKQSDDSLQPRLSVHHQEWQTSLSENLESQAVAAFAAMQPTRTAIARNYLNLKAFVAAAGDELLDLIRHSDGSLVSLADVLLTVKSFDKVVTPLGVGFWGRDGSQAAPILPLLGSEAPAAHKVNLGAEALVNEYATLIAGVAMRWPVGLGEYTVGKMDEAMHGEGLLLKRDSDVGIVLTINSHAIGLTDQLSEFQEVRVPVTRFSTDAQDSLHSIQQQVDHESADRTQVSVPPPQWKGDLIEVDSTAATDPHSSAATKVDGPLVESLELVGTTVHMGGDNSTSSELDREINYDAAAMQDEQKAFDTDMSDEAARMNAPNLTQGLHNYSAAYQHDAVIAKQADKWRPSFSGTEHSHMGGVAHMWHAEGTNDDATVQPLEFSLEGMFTDAAAGTRRSNASSDMFDPAWMPTPEHVAEEQKAFEADMLNETHVLNATDGLLHNHSSQYQEDYARPIMQREEGMWRDSQDTSQYMWDQVAHADVTDSTLPPTPPPTLSWVPAQPADAPLHPYPHHAPPTVDSVLEENELVQQVDDDDDERKEGRHLPVPMETITGHPVHSRAPDTSQEEGEEAHPKPQADRK